MPKRPAETYDSDNGFVEDAPSSKPSKKSKTTTAKPKIPSPSKNATPSTTTPQRDENGDKYWPLNAPSTRRLTLNKFKNKWMVNIREYYEVNGEMRPGKKGISLPVEQWERILEVVPVVGRALEEEGVEVGRVIYEGGGGGGDEGGEAEEEVGVKGEVGGEEGEEEKKNYEATSEEDEG